jgi:hypothetical protein
MARKASRRQDEQIIASMMTSTDSKARQIDVQYGAINLSELIYQALRLFPSFGKEVFSPRVLWRVFNSLQRIRACAFCLQPGRQRGQALPKIIHLIFCLLRTSAHEAQHTRHRPCCPTFR